MQKNNLQDIFLTKVRKQSLPVTVFLMNGFQLRGSVTGFDSFTVVLDTDGKQQAMTFAEGEIRRIAGEGGPDCTWGDTTAILQGRPLYGPDDRCNGYVCRLTTGGMETGYLQVDALGGELCTGAYSFDGIPAYEGLAEEGGGTVSEERLYFFGGISYGIRLEDGSFRLMGSPERVSAETAAEQYRHTVEQVQRQRAE